MPKRAATSSYASTTPPKPQHEEKLKEIDIDAYDSDDTNLPF